MKEFINVVKSEYYKIITRKKFILPAVVICLIPITTLVLTLLSKRVSWFGPTAGIGQFKIVENMLFPIALASFIAGSINDDNNSEAVKQFVSSGIRREKFMLAQWFAQTSFWVAVEVVLGILFCLLATVCYKFGDGTVLTLARIAVAETIYTATVISFVHMMMALTKNIGTTIAAACIIFAISGLFFGFATGSLHMDWLDPYWLTNVLDQVMTRPENTEAIRTILLNMGGALVYQAVMMGVAVFMFKKREI